MVSAVQSQSTRLAAAVLSALAISLALLASAGGAQAQPKVGGLTGIDVSNWQRQIDWIAVAGTGNSFVFAKATEGTTFTDLTFPLNRSGSTVLGMRFGAYHMGRPAGGSDAAVVASATAQADYFLSVATPLKGELLPVLDVEYDGGLSVPRLSLWVQTWLGQVVARTGLKPIVYVSPSFWKTKLGDSPVVAAAGHKLWIAHWTAAALPILPGASWGGLGWSFWQWSNCQKIPGITGCVDGDRFNGSSLASVIVPTYPGRVAHPVERPDDRRRPAGRQGARRTAGDVGRRQARRVLVRMAALRRRRPRLCRDHGCDGARRTRRPPPTSGTRSPSASAPSPRRERRRPPPRRPSPSRARERRVALRPRRRHCP